MPKLIGQILLLIASLALLPGAAMSSCGVAEAFGIETHHHTGLEEHDHDHDHCEDVPSDSAPCSKECSFDFGDAQLGKPLPSLSAQILADVSPWILASPSSPDSACEPRAKLIPRADWPPSWNTPPFSGVFRI